MAVFLLKFCLCWLCCFFYTSGKRKGKSMCFGMKAFDFLRDLCSFYKVLIYLMVFCLYPSFARSECSEWFYVEPGYYLVDCSSQICDKGFYCTGGDSYSAPKFECPYGGTTLSTGATNVTECYKTVEGTDVTYNSELYFDDNKVDGANYHYSDVRAWLNGYDLTLYRGNNYSNKGFIDTTFTEEEKSWFNPAWIRIKVPCVKVNNYNVLINDLKTKHYLKLTGEELKAGYFNGKVAKFRTYAELFSDENKNVTANVNINTFLPPPAPALDKEDDPAERIDIPFINPVEMYRKYDLKANLDTKLKVRNSRRGINSYGHFNVENITLKVSQLKLPESYLRAKTFGQTVTLDTNIYPAKDQNIELLGKLNYSKHPRMDMSIKTAQLQFNDMIILGKAFLDSLSIYNELDRISAQGFLKADCNIKTNFKKLRSNGSVIINNGGLNVKGIGKVLADANINLILDNNLLDIQNSSLLINKSKVLIDGRIDRKSVADISIKADIISSSLILLI